MCISCISLCISISIPTCISRSVNEGDGGPKRASVRKPYTLLNWQQSCHGWEPFSCISLQTVFVFVSHIKVAKHRLTNESSIEILHQCCTNWKSGICYFLPMMCQFSANKPNVSSHIMALFEGKSQVLALFVEHIQGITLSESCYGTICGGTESCYGTTDVMAQPTCDLWRSVILWHSRCSIFVAVSYYGTAYGPVCPPNHRYPFSASPDKRNDDNDDDDDDDYWWWWVDDETVTFFLTKVFTSVNLSGKKYGNAERMMAVTFFKDDYHRIHSFWWWWWWWCVNLSGKKYGNAKRMIAVTHLIIDTFIIWWWYTF